MILEFCNRTIRKNTIWDYKGSDCDGEIDPKWTEQRTHAQQCIWCHLFWDCALLFEAACFNTSANLPQRERERAERDTTRSKRSNSRETGKKKWFTCLRPGPIPLSNRKVQVLKSPTSNILMQSFFHEVHEYRLSSP